MLAISNTGYISLSTAGTNWGYLSSGVNYLPNLRSTTISASSAIQVGANALACASGISGTMRYSQISSTMEYCNGSAWVSMGPSATQPISFLVNNGGSNQTVTSGAPTKLSWNTKVFDTNNNFSGNRFTATVPGKYLFSLTAGCTNAGGVSIDYCQAAIYKNGSSAAVNGPQATATNYLGANVVIVLDMANGDYVEGYVTTDTNTVNGNTSTNFSGALLAPQGGGGTAQPAGSNADVQYNGAGALAADTGKFTYASGLLSTPNISTTNISITTINGQPITPVLVVTGS